MKITVYSTGWCGFCQAEKRFLDEHALQYEDIDVESDPQKARELFELSGQTGVPFTVVEYSGEKTFHVLGFDQSKLVEALGL